MQDQKAELIPGAAESWTVSDDGTVYTFKIRADAVWSNGDPVTAEDFVYSFQRLLTPETAAEYASMLYVVKNGEAINKGEMKPEELGVKAIDEKTLEVTLNAPTPYFLEMLTHQANYPVHRGSIEELGEEWIKPGNLVSNGAFTLAEFVPNDHIKIVKNPNFHDAENVKLDVVNYYPDRGPLDRAEALRGGRARFQRRLADRAAGRHQGEARRPGACRPVSRHLLLRGEAGQGAVEQSRAAPRHLHGDRPRLPGREGLGEHDDPGLRHGASRHRGLRLRTRPTMPDMDQIDREDAATEILTKLGYGPDNPLKLEIRYNTSENHQNTAVAIQEQLRPLGIEVTLLNTDTRPHYGHLEQKGDFDFARAGWIADYKDPESFLGISRGGERQQLLGLQQSRVRAADEGGRGRRRQRGRALQAPGGGREGACRRPRQHAAALLQLPHIVSAKLDGWEDNVMDVHPSRFISKEG